MNPKQELIDKVKTLVANNYGGDYKKAFDSYDKDGDGQISMGELVTLLYDAGVGSRFTRGIWAHEVMDALDTDHDDKISWNEFTAVLSQHLPAVQG